MQRPQCGRGSGKDHVGRHFHQLGGIALEALFIAARPTIFERNVAALRPPQFLQLHLECREPSLRLGISLSKRRQDADAAHPLLLRARRERPRHCGAYERDERAAFHCPMPPGASDRKDSTPRYGRDCCAAEFRSDL